jgi:hypothetical protein
MSRMNKCRREEETVGTYMNNKMKNKNATQPKQFQYKHRIESTSIPLTQK